MGNYMTKLLTHNHVAHSGKEESLSKEEPLPVKTQKPAEENFCTPIGFQKKLFIDPRSATIGIHRTPIEVNSIPLTHNLRTRELLREKKPYLETDIDRVMPPLTPNKPELQLSELESQKDYLTPTMKNSASFSRKLTTTQSNRFGLFGLDPRSPAVDFNRTPILTSAAMLPLRGRSQENLNKQSFEANICRYSYCETSSEFGISEVQVLPDFVPITIQALNMDVECQDELDKSESPCSTDTPNTVIVDSDDRNNSFDFIKPDNADAQRNMCISDPPPNTEGSNIIRRDESLGQVSISLKLDDQTEITETEVKDDKPVAGEMRSSKKHSYDADKIFVWRDSMSSLPQLEQVGILESNDQKNIFGKTMVHSTKEDVIITFDDDMVVKDSLSSKISKVPSENPRKPEIVKRHKNTKGEKVLADDKKMFSDNKTLGDTIKTRTPLGNRSNNGQVSLLAAKSPQLLRNKGITPKMLQENTPPHRRSTVKSKLSGMQWDPDSTVLI